MVRQVTTNSLIIVVLFLVTASFLATDSAMAKPRPGKKRSCKAKPKQVDPEVLALRERLDSLQASQTELVRNYKDLKDQLGASQADVQKLQNEAQAAKEAAKVVEVEKIKKEEVAKKAAPGGKPTLKTYGFIRADSARDSTRMNNVVDPAWVLPRNTALVEQRAPEYNTHARFTRLGFDYSGSKTVDLEQARLSGKFEADFDTPTAVTPANGVPESRVMPRIRHAFVRADWKELYAMAGQTWDLISPLFPTANPGFLMWNVGNTGDRRPQLRLGFEPGRNNPNKQGQFSLAVAAGLTGAVDNLDLDGNAHLDGIASDEPDWQARIGWTSKPPKNPKKDAFSVGVWGRTAHTRTVVPVRGRTRFDSDIVGMDAVVPLAPRFSLRGELWSGDNLSDVRGGIGQGIALGATFAREIHSQGGWGELTINPKGRWFASLGYSEDHPRLSDLAGTSNRRENHVYYVTNRFRLGGGYELGFDVSSWRTGYTNNVDETNTRLELSVLQHI